MKEEGGQIPARRNFKWTSTESISDLIIDFVEKFLLRGHNWTMLTWYFWLHFCDWSNLCVNTRTGTEIFVYDIFAADCLPPPQSVVGSSDQTRTISLELTPTWVARTVILSSGEQSPCVPASLDIIWSKTSFVQLNSTSLLCPVLSAACSFHHCCCCQLGSKPVFTHECLSKIGLVLLVLFLIKCISGTRPKWKRNHDH